MMDFRTEVGFDSDFSIGYSDRLMMLGSCFTENIGQKFTDSMLNVVVNPFGILFNPESIADAVERAIDGIHVTDADVFEHNGLWSSFGFHGSFSSASKSEAISRMNAGIDKAHEWIGKTSKLILTFGTAFVYRLSGNGKIVANCHKLPSDRFTREMLGVQSIVDRYALLIDRLSGINPNMQIILTVSPIRHLRDGAHQNQLSKSTLLLATNALVEKYGNVHYFPSYEIVLDDLRDYRFYDTDMVHPSGMAIDYIWQKLCSKCFSAGDLATMDDIRKLQSALNHRPINPDTDEFRNFASRQLDFAKQLAQKHSDIDFSKAIGHWQGVIDARE